MKQIRIKYPKLKKSNTGRNAGGIFLAYEYIKTINPSIKKCVNKRNCYSSDIVENIAVGEIMENVDVYVENDSAVLANVGVSNE